MNILIVGGTGFLGGAITHAALAHGHKAFTLSRGQKPAINGAIPLKPNDPIPPMDRIIDTRAYTPAMVRDITDQTPAHYTYVSSISVYDRFEQANLDENNIASPADRTARAHAAQILPDQRANAAAYGTHYGPLKKSGEDAAGDNALIIRLGLIIGPADYTDRFTWWVRRIDQGGIIPVPEPRDRPMQFIDVHDAAIFILDHAIAGTAGIFNLTGQPSTFDTMLQNIHSQTGSQIEFDWRPLKHFTNAGLQTWTDLPFITPDDLALIGFLCVNTDKARNAGLQTRPLVDTITDTLTWDRARRDIPLSCGMSAVDDQLVLSKPSG